MKVLAAAWVCSISHPPIRDGWVAIECGRIGGVGAPGEEPEAPRHHLGNVAVMPGLVNAHTHLELSWLRGRVPPAASFVDWIKQLFVTRGGRVERPEDRKVTDAARRAAVEMRQFGTSAVGDISNSLASVEPIHASGMRGLVFHELLGFNLPHGQSVIDTRPRRAMAARLGDGIVRVSVAPHAPYSVSPEMFRAIREEVDSSPVPITSVHVGESESEVDFLRDGSGPWPGILRWVGSTRDDWSPPGIGPVEYLDSLGMLDARTLVVHGVQLEQPALERLASIGCTLVTCPRSNQWVGAGAPPIARFYAAGVKVAVGTDSLASVEDLNLFAELKTMRWLAPDVPARELLASATRNGAEALGLSDDLGTIEVGKRAELIAVALPEPALQRRMRPSARVESALRPFDVEEHLVTGIDARQVFWVTD
jgi:5-methylthioadenosine/S-adenosylhomocysteine deaminase